MWEVAYYTKCHIVVQGSLVQIHGLPSWPVASAILAFAFPKWRKVKPKNEKILKVLSFLAATSVQLQFTTAS